MKEKSINAFSNKSCPNQHLFSIGQGLNETLILTEIESLKDHEEPIILN